MAVHQRGGEPKIFDYADVLQCEVAEAGDPEAEEVASKQEFAQRILANPAKAAKINAAKRNMCLGMGVVVAVQTGKDEVSKLEIPVMTDEVKRDSSYISRIGMSPRRSRPNLMPWEGWSNFGGIRF